MQFENWLKAKHPDIPTSGAAAVLKLAAEGATIPFIARYRKEQTGNLDEVAIQKAIEAKEKWDEIVRRQAYIVEEIEKQQKLTPELKDKILGTFEPQLLEDLYLPYKQKRKTKAAKAKEAGLEPLADWIWNCGHGTESPQPGQTLELWALTFRNDQHDVKDAAAAVQGAQDIIVERLAEKQDLRQFVRDMVAGEGFVRTEKGAKAQKNSKFEKYFVYQEGVKSLLEPQNSHRYLAARRGWMEEELKLSIGGDVADPSFDDRLLAPFEAAACTVHDSPGADVLKKAARLALKAHVFSSIESEVHQSLKSVADEAAIKVFSENLRTLLLAAPFGSKAVLGVDPGIRTGCKVAVVDDSGKFLADTIFNLQTEPGKEQAKKMLAEVCKGGKIRAIAVGNGTAGRETESWLRGAVKELGESVPVVMVNESGASVYSASEVAREEFPDLDVTVRGAISIARRLQDPLAELVKIDPKSIGVGQYQHDVSPHALKKSLDLVVDSCVNAVGVDVNTASSHLLARVSGIGPGLAKAIVEHRGAKGLFKSRESLNEVPRFSKKAYEQAAGFLRVPGADNPLDNTGVHPERYPLLEKVAASLGKAVKDLIGPGAALVKKANELRDELGEFTFADVVRELEKPGRDPREEFVPFQYRDDIHEVKDLKQGMLCPGIVTNVTNFGAFVDIGVHQDGLVHISQLADRFVKDPSDVVSPGDRVQVKVLEVNLEKNQIALTMKLKSDKRVEAPSPRPMQPQRRVAPPKAAPAVRPQQAFNNAFAGLANMLKSKGK